MEIPPRSKGSPHGRKRTQTSSWRNLRTNREAVRQRIDHPAWRASCPGGPDHFDGIDFRRLRARDGRVGGGRCAGTGGGGGAGWRAGVLLRGGAGSGGGKGAGVGGWVRRGRG